MYVYFQGERIVCLHLKHDCIDVLRGGIRVTGIDWSHIVHLQFVFWFAVAVACETLMLCLD